MVAVVIVVIVVIVVVMVISTRPEQAFSRLEVCHLVVHRRCFIHTDFKQSVVDIKRGAECQINIERQCFSITRNLSCDAHVVLNHGFNIHFHIHAMETHIGIEVFGVDDISVEELLSVITNGQIDSTIGITPFGVNCKIIQQTVTYSKFCHLG